MIDLKCEDNLANNDDIAKKSFKMGDIFMANCASNCVD